MKRILLILAVAIFTESDAFAQSIIELEPSQSMSITGKGAGQDAVMNPFLGSECIAVVENLGQNEFEIRIQENGTVVQTITVKKGENKNVKLEKDQELYFDSEKKAKVQVAFAQING